MTAAEEVAAELGSALRDFLGAYAHPVVPVEDGGHVWSRLSGELGLAGLLVPESRGGLGFGAAELVAVARHRAAWPDPRLVLLVLNTRSGHPRYAGSPHPPTDDVPYAGWARLLGLRGIRVDRPELVGAAGAEAFGADRPCLLELVVGPAGMDPAGVLRTVGVDSRRSPD
ncbi:hypothetical protein EYA84_27305 [Verrucosispora sp. SN26_14.1]|uniref:hypothetical protein n=1 Tax=Verrucosispora sp. SN26_14.1 TaxID=2527879 RepID=UPI001033FBE7|nr:hypothetical protein [Verrucosispora sp. SN26_14.1]TBL28225.1 hypothetical protein EYA84_27305 [Verrucosispora sp. SN26_14.1]